MSEEATRFSGRIVDVIAGTIFPGTVTVAEGRILTIEADPKAEGPYIMPGFVDAHVHIESSMLVPTEFARLAVPFGTVATVSDPHEIGNVLGIDGVRFMIENGKKSPFKFYFGAPSCVPATTFETAGAEIGPADVETLLEMPEVVYLAEMMNFPGVLHRDPIVWEKINIAKALGKPIDGHAPGLRGKEALKYISAGISTDHECFTREEALDKLRYGMKIQIREGSAARNFEALYALIDEYPDRMMFCSDDKHPNDLMVGHLDRLARRAVAKGMDVMNVLRALTRNVVQHYGLDVGLLQTGDPADFILVEDLNEFRVLATYIDGKQVATEGTSLLSSQPTTLPNKFDASPITADQLTVPAQKSAVRVIEVMDGQLITNEVHADLPLENGALQVDLEQDILKIAVVNRYEDAPPAVAFVKGFGLKSGAIAGSVAHDSHNIVAVGTNDADLTAAINLVIEAKGGLSHADGDDGIAEVIPLPIAGLMSDQDGYAIGQQYDQMSDRVVAAGATLAAPYMTLSFCALLVIPQLKLSDLGLFDGNSFEFVPLERA